MTTEQKHTIEIQGLPEGWLVKEIKLWDALYEITPGSYNYNPCINTAKFRCELIVEKIKPRRIVLEETNEERRICYGEWYESQEGKLMRWPYGGKTDGKHRVWREVKETDTPLNNSEPKLSLSVDECKEAMRKLETFNVTDLSVKICRFLKEHS